MEKATCEKSQISGKSVVNLDTQEIQNRLLGVADELSALYDMQYDYPTLSEGRDTIRAKINNLVNEKFDIHFALAHIHQQEAGN